MVLSLLIYMTNQIGSHVLVVWIIQECHLRDRRFETTSAGNSGCQVLQAVSQFVSHLALNFFASSQAYVLSVTDCTFLVIVTTASVFLYNLEELTGKTMAEPF